MSSPPPGGGSTSTEDDDDEFYDADEVLSLRSRGNSLKRNLELSSLYATPSTANATPTFKTAEHSLAEQVELQHQPIFSMEQEQQQHVLEFLQKQSVLLPDEIEQELIELTQEDVEKRKRVHRLRRLQRGDSGVRVEEDEEEEDLEEEEDVKTRTSKHQFLESRESSVEGVYVPRHPFKVIESDNRSTNSDSRSIHSSSSRRSLKEQQQQHQQQRRLNQQQRQQNYEKRDSLIEINPSASSSSSYLMQHQKQQHECSSVTKSQTPSNVPDIVSSIQSEKFNAISQGASSSTDLPISQMTCEDEMLSRSSSVITMSRTSETVTANSGFCGNNAHNSGNNAANIPVFSISDETYGPNEPYRPPRRKKSPTQFAYPHDPFNFTPSPLTRPPHTTSTSAPLSEAEKCNFIESPTNLLTPTSSSMGPASTVVASLTRSLDRTLVMQQQEQLQQQSYEMGGQQLDLRSATRGQFVVKPQDDERSRGGGFFSREEILFEVEEQFEQEQQRRPSSSGKISHEEGKKFLHNTLEHQMSLPNSASDIGALASKNPAGIIPVGRGGVGSGGSRSHKSGFITGSGSGGRRSMSSKGGHSSLGSSSTGGGSKAGGGGNGGFGSVGRRSSSGLNSATGSMDSGSILGSGSSAMRQMNMYLRTKSESGKKLTDEDILKQIKVKNLDTGEEMDLVEAEDKLPPSVNPLSLHIMRLTSEYVSSDKPNKALTDSDTESLVSSAGGYDLFTGKKNKKSAVKRFLGDAVKNVKRTGEVAKSLAAEATKRRAPKEPLPPSATSTTTKDMEKLGRLSTDIKAAGSSGFKRIQAHKSGPFDFENIQFAQELPSQHLGPIWCMRFSQCGQLLATAGQDTAIRIWVVKDAYNTFKEMRSRYNSDISKSSTSPTNSYDNVMADQEANMFNQEDDKRTHVFNERPFCSYNGHTSEVLDLCWSKNYFLLSSSMDKTVRLWHISRRECLCCFQHIDFVTALAFHPRNDQFFLSASLDGKLRLWNIPDKKVTLWNEIDGQSKLITAANFIQNGKFAVVGTYDGRCIFYSTDQLKYYTMIHVRSTRGKNAQGRKVTGIEPMPGEDKILVTSNDSRIRIYDLRDLSLTCKYKGYSNSSSQIRATFSHDGKYISAGSENQCVFLWKTQYESTNLTSRKDRNSFYEAIKAHSAVVTCSVFATNPDIILNQIKRNSSQYPDESSRMGNPNTLKTIGGGVRAKTSKAISSNKSGDSESNLGYVIVSGDFDGDIKVFYVFSKPKHSSLPITSVLSNA